MSWGYLGALCGGPEGAASLLGLFLVGLAGSPLHCAPMCGPFVLARAAGRMAGVPAARLCERHRLMSGALLPYHVGRIATYAALGAIAGGLGAGLRALPWLGWLSGVLLLGAGVAVLSRSAARLVPAWLASGGGSGLALAGHFGGWLGGRFAMPRIGGDLVFGAALGFLPCGLVYTALATAMTMPGAFPGALAMVAFGLGTVPALVVVGCAGGRLARALPARVAAWAPVVLALPGLLLVVLGARALAAA